MRFIGRTLDCYRKWSSGGSIEIKTTNPNNDADLESYRITTKNGFGSQNTVRLHEGDGITLKSNSTITLDAPLVNLGVTALEKYGVDNIGFSFFNKIDINHENNGNILITGSKKQSGQATSSFKLLLSRDSLEITLATERDETGQEKETQLTLNPNSLQTLKKLLGL